MPAPPRPATTGSFPLGGGRGRPQPPGPALIGAYGLGLQGWDVSYMFQNGDDGTFSRQIGSQQWDVTAPQILGVFPAVARQVLRGDVSESDVIAARNVHPASLFEGRLSFGDTVAQGYDDKELDSSKGPARARPSRYRYAGP